MRFEELQAIWETQGDKPLFSINEFGLHMALNQQRERGRRALFWRVFFPSFVTYGYMIGALAFAGVAFYFKDTSERDFPMGLSDALAFLLAASAFAFAGASMWRSRRRHERSQNIVSPSLRQEIDRSIAQIEFEIHAGTSRAAWRNTLLTCLGALLFVWEMGRFNGEVAPWGIFGFTVAVCTVSLLLGWLWARGWRADRVRRLQALEALRAKLDANDQSSSGVPKSTLTGS